MEINKLYCETNLDTMGRMPNNFIDLTVTSPPYDGLRTYNGYSFDFESIAKELFRVTKPGGVVVWVVGDATVKGSETGTSFKQALYFMGCGFALNDTMIFAKKNPFPSDTKYRYYQSFEYMFILSKGKPKTFNPIKIEKQDFRVNKKRDRVGDLTVSLSSVIKPQSHKIKNNIFEYSTTGSNSTSDKIAFDHPAIFPEKLAEDHILSWSNEKDLVYDPFMGSGTTAKMAFLNNRNYIGSEISSEYVEIANQRLVNAYTEWLSA